MKKHYALYLAFCLFTIYIFTTASSGGRASVANSDNTGSPTSSVTCSNCHSGGAYGTVTLNIQVFQLGTTNAVTQYVPGTAYDMRVTVNNTNGTPLRYGFQLTAFTFPGNSPVGGYSNLSSNVKTATLSNGRTYLEHNNPSTTNTFNFRWTAPSAGTGSVRFYTAGIAANNFGSSGDNGGSSNFTIAEAQSLSVTGTTTNVSCAGGSNGSINITATGGSSPYSYNWGSGITTEDRTNLTAGAYTVTVTDASNATVSASFTVTQPNAISATANTTDVSCFGGNNGSITLTTSGGTGALSYNWGNNITTQNRTNLSAGSYTVTITDANSCTATFAYTVNQPSVPLSATFTGGNILCAGGSALITITPSGGTPPYNTPANPVVTAGNNSFIITDSKNCSFNLQANITEPAPITASATTVTIPCNGGSDTIVVTASGGTAPYTGTGNFIVSQPGTYTYNVSDANGCSTSASGQALAASGLNATATVNNVNCYNACNGSLSLSVTGGDAPYAYNWSAGSSSTSSAQNLCAGAIEVTITDNSGCALVNQYTITQPDSLIAALDEITINSLNGTGTITINVSGGTAPYQYAWNNTQISASLQDVNPGSYSVTVTDANNCTVTLGDLAIVLTSANEIESLNYRIYPNPSVNYFNVVAQGQNTELRLYDIQGSAVLQQTLAEGNNRIDTYNLPGGLYIIEVKDQNAAVVRQRITIQR